MVNDGYGDFEWPPFDGEQSDWFLPRPDEEMPGLVRGVMVRPSYREWSWTEAHQIGVIDDISPDGLLARVRWYDRTTSVMQRRHLVRVWGPGDPPYQWSPAL